MTNFEESAKSYENDYRFAPVGMAVGSFWGGALAAGLVGFVMSTGIAKGFIPITIHGGQRVLFADDTRGLMLGLAIAIILLSVSIVLGVVGYLATLKKRDLGALWKLSIFVVPVLSAVGTIFGIALFH